MATFIKATQVVEAASLLLQRELVLPRLVWRLADSAYSGTQPYDDTVTVKVPAVLAANSRTMRSSTALQAGTLTQTKVPVKLTDHIYQLLEIRDEELTLDIRDFSSEVLAPQIRAVAEGFEDLIADTIGGVDWQADAIVHNQGDDAYDTLVDAGAALDELNVPASNRVVVCGSQVKADFLKSDKLSKVNESGSDSALREATLARVAGFTVVGSNAVGPYACYAFHQTAVAMASVAPSLPEGATMAARQSFDGIAMRYLRDYNPSGAAGPVDRSLVDTFAGAASVEDETSGTNKRGVEIYFGVGS